MEQQNTNVFWLALAAMEAYRLKGGRNDPPDYAIRVCQSLLAEALGVKTRVEWTQKIQQEGLLEYSNDLMTVKGQYKSLVEQIRKEIS